MGNASCYNKLNSVVFVLLAVKDNCLVISPYKKKKNHLIRYKFNSSIPVFILFTKTK